MVQAFVAETVRTCLEKGEMTHMSVTTFAAIYYSVLSVQTKKGASWGCTYRKPLLCLGA